jgi:uracil-DNA glycosylase family 4
VSAADDQIYEKYQARAIEETNALGHEIAQWVSDHHPATAPVIGTGHPLADIMMVKYRPQPSEVQEGVAFFGRAGQAVLKSLERLRIDPLKLYGTVCLKLELDPEEEDLLRAREWLTRELHIVQPGIVVAMGEETVAFVNALRFPLAQEVSYAVGEIQQLTPTIELLAVPDIDRSLNEAAAKQAFWAAFKVLGEWYENLPPY